MSAILVLGILVISGMYLSNSVAEAKRQSQSTTTLCYEETGTCNTTVCIEELLDNPLLSVPPVLE